MQGWTWQISEVAKMLLFQGDSAVNPMQIIVNG
jgi:hypothetical protein